MKIGFYDSGLGGLTVLSRFISEVPQNDFFYFGDNKNAPYGDKDGETLKKLFQKNIKLFYDNGIKHIVLACNTMSTTLFDWATANFADVKFYPITPLVDYSRLNNNCKCYVFCTVKTAESISKSTQYNIHKDKVKIISCKGLVELIEKNEITIERLSLFLPKEKCEVGQVVLGCTHYEIIRDLFKCFYPKAFFTDNVAPVIKAFGNTLSGGTLTFLGESKKINASSFPIIYKKINKNGFFLPKVVDNYHKWLYNIITTTKKGGF